MANLNIKLVKEPERPHRQAQGERRGSGPSQDRRYHRAARQRGYPGQDRSHRLPAPGDRGKTKRRRETMNLHELSPPGSNTKAYRKGRGEGSGNGKTMRPRPEGGQWSRSGGGVRVGFEGRPDASGPPPAKRGFHNIFAKPLEAVNVSVLEKFEDGAVVNAQALLERHPLQVRVRREDPGQWRDHQEADCSGFPPSPPPPRKNRSCRW